MSRVSRRALARWAAEQLVAGQAAKAVAKHLASALIDNSRQGELEFLISDISWELEKGGELVTAKVTSTEPLNQHLLAELKKQIKQLAAAKQVQLDENIDKSVLGGVRVETASRVWDDTVRRKLIELRETF